MTVASSVPQARVSPKGAMLLEPFDYEGVRLLPGRFQSQIEQARALYGGLSNDSILKGFRRQAGMAAPGEDMKGWASETCSGIFGQLVSGMVRLGKAAGDGELMGKAKALHEGFLETLPADGNAHMRAYDLRTWPCWLWRPSPLRLRNSQRLPPNFHELSQMDAENAPSVLLRVCLHLD